MGLTVAQFQQAYQGAVAIDDDGLQLLLDAADQAISARAGSDLGPFVDVVDGGGSYVFLRRRAVGISSIVERCGATDTTLDTTDWRLRADGVSVLRLATGTHYGARWGELVTITSDPLDFDAERDRVQRALVMLDLNYAPGNSSEQIGAWMEQKAASSVWNYEAEREAILASLDAGHAPGFA